MAEQVSRASVVSRVQVSSVSVRVLVSSVSVRVLVSSVSVLSRVLVSSVPVIGVQSVSQQWADGSGWGICEQSSGAQQAAPCQ